MNIQRTVFVFVLLEICSSVLAKIDGITLIVAHTRYGSSGSGVLGVAQLNGELFVTRDRETQVAVYDVNSFNLKRRIAIPSSRSFADGLAVSPFHNYLYVSSLDSDNAYYVHVVNLTSNATIHSWKTPEANPRLSVSRATNNVIVTHGYSITEYAANGTPLRTTSDITGVWQAIETKSGSLLDSRRGPLNGVAELSWQNTKVLRSYGKQAGSAEGRMNYPRSLDVDSHGHILVADTGNNRIQVLDSSLTVARTVQLPAEFYLYTPNALCFDESRGRLYVGEGSGEYRVLGFNYVIDGASLSAGNNVNYLLLVIVMIINII